MCVVLKFLAFSYPIPCRLVGMKGISRLELCSILLFKVAFFALVASPFSGSSESSLFLGGRWGKNIGFFFKWGNVSRNGTHCFYSRNQSQGHTELWWRLRYVVQLWYSERWGRQGDHWAPAAWRCRARTETHVYLTLKPWSLWKQNLYFTLPHLWISIYDRFSS